VSPALFHMYIRSLIDSLIKSDLGCHVYGVYIGCLVYADDVILLSASVLQLQKMLGLCSNQAADIDIVLMPRNQVFLPWWKLFDCNLLNLHLSSDVISWSESGVSWLVF